MKKITNEIKAKIYAPYVGVSEAFRTSTNISLGKLTHWDIHKFLYDNSGDIYIELTPLEHISDEDTIELSNMLKISLLTDTDMRLPISEIKTRISYYIDDFARRSFSDSVKIYQYLQSKGYALPYMDYSVKDLVKLGVYKLKQ